MHDSILKRARRLACTAVVASAIGAVAVPAMAEVKIGLLVGFTGDMGPWASALNNAAILAVEEINAAGGILGEQVTLIPEDNASTVAGAVRGGQKLASVDKVSVIIGPESDPMVSLLQFAKDNQLPIITTSAGTEALDQAGGTGTFVYRTNASDTFLGVVHAKLILDELGAKEVAVVVENLEGTQSGAKTFMRNFEKFGGKITKVVTLTPGQTTYLNELRDLAGADPKVVFLSASQSTGVTFAKQAFQRGYEWQWWVPPDLQSDDYVKAAGTDVVKGTLSAVGGSATDSDAWARFSEAYEKRFGEKPVSGYYQAETYDAFIVAALAMEAAGKTDGKSIDDNLVKVATPEGTKVISFADGVKALKAGEDIDYEGASGTINFNEYGNVAVPVAQLLEIDESGAWVVKKIVDSSAFPAN